jgi:glycosyltransferase involved in cell wall biosynthesis
VKIIFDPVDLHSVRYAREFELTGEKSLAARASTYAQVEKRITETVDLTWCASSEDMRMLAEFAPAARAIVIPTIHAIGPEGKPFDDRRDLFFLGNMLHTPNLDSVRYLVEDILPRVWRELPGVNLLIAGGPINATLQAYESDRVRILGYVPDINPYFAGCRLMVAPIRFGAGINGKIGESMANGLPVVTTTLAARSFGIVDGRHALVADDAASFATAIAKVYEDGELWGSLARNGRTLIAEGFAPGVIDTAITQSIEELIEN